MRKKRLFIPVSILRGFSGGFQEGGTRGSNEPVPKVHTRLLTRTVPKQRFGRRRENKANEGRKRSMQLSDSLARGMLDGAEFRQERAARLIRVTIQSGSATG
jgi:hypothetical protein